MNSLENYLLSLQLNNYNTSISQIVEIQIRTWQSLQSRSLYARELLETLKVTHYSLQQQHHELLKHVLPLLGYRTKQQHDNTLLIEHKRLTHWLNLS